jgi:hypothetical protein
MNKKFTLLILAVLFLTLINSACQSPFAGLFKRKEQQTKSNQAKPSADKKVPMAGKNFDLSTETGKISSQIFTEFQREKFTWLEEQTKKARVNKELLPGGYWKLRNIYLGIDRPRLNTDEEYQNHFAKLNRWKAQFPDSITPRVAIAETWINYATEARGVGYANTVSRENQKLFSERVAKAEKELFEAKDLAEKCPSWYLAVLAVANLQSWSLSEFDAIYQEAISFEPNYYYFYRIKAMYLLPRWHGQDGDFENYLEQTSNKIGGEQGDIIYFLVYSKLEEYPDLPLNRLSWERAKRGYYALKEKYGVEKQRLNEFAKNSYRLGDYAEANKAFDEIGNDWLIESWGTEQFYKNAKSATKDIVQKTPPEVLPKMIKYNPEAPVANR